MHARPTALPCTTIHTTWPHRCHVQSHVHTPRLKALARCGSATQTCSAVTYRVLRNGGLAKQPVALFTLHHRLVQRWGLDGGPAGHCQKGNRRRHRAVKHEPRIRIQEHRSIQSWSANKLQYPTKGVGAGSHFQRAASCHATHRTW
jgi:hypothetical protein